MASEQPPKPAASSGEASADNHPGRPIGRDEIDPELMTLPRTAIRIGPLLALSMVVFAVYIMAALWPDLRFSRQSAEPAVVPSAAELLATDDLADSLVTVTVVPDRALAVRVATSEGLSGHRLVPVQGTDDRLWLMLEGRTWNIDLKYEEQYTGRPRPLADMPFAEQLHAHVDERPPAPRFATGEAVKAALSAHSERLELPGGDTAAVTPETPVVIYQRALDRVKIEAVATERYPDAAAWTAALAELGLISADAEPTLDQFGAWIYLADAPDGPEAVSERVHEAKLFSAAVRPLESEHRATWQQLEARADALALPDATVPWAQVSWVSVATARAIPADAWVLIQNQHPGHYWYVLPLFSLLGLSALLFGWALIRSLKSYLLSRAARAE